MAINLNPTIFGRPLFPSSEKLKEYGSTIASTFAPAAGTPPATMAGVSIPPAGASFGQLQFSGPLINTSRFNQQAAPQPAQKTQTDFDYGTFAATRGLPAFDVTKTQTPFSAQNQINTAALTGQTSPLSFAAPAQQPFAVTQQQPLADRTAVTFQGAEPMSGRRATIMATPEQLTNLESRQTAYESRTPAQQQALIAQMRQRGAEIGRNMVEGQEKFFAQKRAERAALAGATVEAYKSGASPQSIREARASYVSQQPSSIAGIQRQYATMAPTFNRPMAERTAFVLEPFGIPSGGKQPASLFAESFPLIEDRARNPFGSIYGFGV